MGSPEKYLTTERDLRNLSLEEIEKFTKIKEDFLRAIEEDKYEILPPAIYVKGFLTIYARYLGLNPLILRSPCFFASIIKNQVPSPTTVRDIHQGVAFIIDLTRISLGD
jgi:hypothetical protein